MARAPQEAPSSTTAGGREVGGNPGTTTPGGPSEARVDPAGGDGASSTHRSDTRDTSHGVCEAGVDTWRLLFKADAHEAGSRVFDLGDGYRGNWFPEHALLAVEGHPAGRGVLARPEALHDAYRRVVPLVERYGAVFAGAARADLTVGYRFAGQREGRAFFAGMAAIELPRCETTRRGSPVHSVWWTGAKGREIKGRVYDKGLERGTAEAFELGRLEDQRRFPSGHRPHFRDLGDPDYARSIFARRFAPVRQAVDGVKCASIPVIGQALADEARYGYRTWAEAERLAGSLILLSGGAREAYPRRTFYRRRAELRDAGYVVADSWMEPVEVDLGEVVTAAVESEAWA